MWASSIRHLAAARSAPRIAAGFYERTVQLWDVQTCAKLAEFETVLDFGGDRLALSPDGTRCVAACWRKGVRGGVACYDAMSGNVLWHRTDFRQTQHVRFSFSNDIIWWMPQEGRVHRLNSVSGETLETVRGFVKLRECPYSGNLLIETRRERGYLLKGKKQVRIPQLTFAMLDAAFSPEAVCLTESSGPVRCLDCSTGAERWRFDPGKGSHVLSLFYRELDRNFYGIQWSYNRGGPHSLVRFEAQDGRATALCLMDSWEEAFCLSPDCVIASNGEIISLADGRLLNRLPFPEEEYPNRIRRPRRPLS